MVWFRVDDLLPDHRKVRKLGRYKVPALGLWTLCGAWAGRNLTDGWVPDEVVEQYDSRHHLAARLCDAELWERAKQNGETGYLFHDWSPINPTRAEVLKEREDTRLRVKRWRERNRSGNALQQAGDDHAEPHDPEGGNAVGNALQGVVDAAAGGNETVTERSRNESRNACTVTSSVPRMEQSPSSAVESNALRTALVTVPPTRPVGEGREVGSSDTPGEPAVGGCVGGRNDLETPPPPVRQDAASPPRKRSGQTHGTRIPDDFAVTAEMVQWARDNTPHVDGRYETEKFQDYWNAKTGRDATKRDWGGTWRNWMRKAEEQADQSAGRGSRRRTADDKINDLMAMADGPSTRWPERAISGPSEPRTATEPPEGTSSHPRHGSAALSGSQRPNPLPRKDHHDRD
jgi:hypothetical protein